MDQITGALSVAANIGQVITAIIAIWAAVVFWRTRRANIRALEALLDKREENEGLLVEDAAVLLRLSQAEVEQAARLSRRIQSWVMPNFIGASPRLVLRTKGARGR